MIHIMFEFKSIYPPEDRNTQLSKPEIDKVNIMKESRLRNELIIRRLYRSFDSKLYFEFIKNKTIDTTYITRNDNPIKINLLSS